MEWVTFAAGMLLGMMFGGSISRARASREFWDAGLKAFEGLKTDQVLVLEVSLGRHDAGGEDGGDDPLDPFPLRERSKPWESN